MHIGTKNKYAKYVIDTKEIGRVMEEKDLGVIIDKSFKVGKQCAKASKKGNQILGMISRSFSCKNQRVMLQLYKSLVRPHLNYCIQVWRPHLQKDKEAIEKVQRRATRMILECRGLSYENRLKKVGLTTLETRRQRADMLEVYKIMNGLEGVIEKDFFLRDRGGRRGHSYKLFQKG